MLLPWKTQGRIWRRSLPKKAQRHVAKTLTQALVDGGCAFLLKKKCKSHQILASSDSPKPNPFLEQIHCQPPSKWGRNHCSYKLSCVVLSHPQTLPSHRCLPIFLTQLLFWLSASQVSPHPQLHYLPPTPPLCGPPLTPCYPTYTPPHPPFPQGKPTAPSPLCLLFPSLPLPPSSTSVSPCLCVREASKGRERGCRGGETERQELGWRGIL